MKPPALDSMDQYELGRRRYHGMATDSFERWHAFTVNHPRYVPGEVTMATRSKSQIIPEVRREEYAMHFVLRVRRAWNRMPAEERREALLAGADQLEEYARQMRSEAEEIAG